MRTDPARTTVAPFALAMLLLVLLGGLAYRSIDRLLEHARWVEHTERVIANTRELLGLAVDAETGQRGYIITGQERFLEPFHRATRLQEPALRRLQALTRDNPRQQARLRRLAAEMERRRRYLEATLRLRRAGRTAEVQAIVASGRGKALTDRVRALAAEMEREEAGLLRARSVREERSARTTLLLVALTLAFGAVSLAAATLRLRVEMGRRLRAENDAVRAAGELRALSMTDPLTGLSNRRGFTLLAESHCRYAHRLRHHLVLLYLDLDNMKPVNDTHGHAAGDRALVETAALLRHTFRETDLLARLGGDEFAVLATLEQPDDAARLVERLQDAVRERNARGDLPFALALSVGAAPADPAQVPTLPELLARADHAMYLQKRARRAHPAPASLPTPPLPLSA